MSRKIAILGGGISGLSLAYFLKQKGADSLSVFEASEKAGGWIQTEDSQGFLFEQGPRSLRTKGDHTATFSLIQSLGLSEQVLFPSPEANQRFIYTRGKLRPLPRHLWQLPFYSLTRNIFQVLWKDWTAPKRKREEESIASFFSRRLGEEWLENIVDPFISGIYAGDVSRLSMSSCFPLLEAWEQKEGSLLKGAWKNRSPKKQKHPLEAIFKSAPLFSFKNGMATLPQTLSERLGESLRLQHSLTKLTLSGERWILSFKNQSSVEADTVISTLPTYALASLLPEVPSLSRLRYANIVVVNLGFSQNIGNFKGFGYLVPSKEKSPILGCVWDSALFPEQNASPLQTRWTVMMGGSHHENMVHQEEELLLALALSELKKQIGVEVVPSVVQIKKIEKAIPQWELGYGAWKKQVEKEAALLSPSLYLSGSAFAGISVHDCIRHASQLSSHLLF